MEKRTDRLALNYFESVYNRVYNTENNKTLFNSFVPDGWLYDEDNHNLLIIENKQSVSQEKEAKQQLQKYINTVCLQGKQPLNIYCMFCSGVNQELFTVKYYNERLQPINEQVVINTFKQPDKNKVMVNGHYLSNAKPCITPQQIHNMLVKNFHYEKPNELYDILLIILLSFTCDDTKQYYKYNSQQVDKVFIDILCQNALDTLGKQYEKYTDTIKHTEFNNVFNTCKTIYEAYNTNYNIIGSLLDQFKKYKQDYTTNKNEVWTDKDIAMLMFNEVKPLCNHLVNKLGYINVFDPCVGGGNLLKPFINEFNNKVKLYGCDILKHYTMLNKLELLINNIQGDFYNVDYMEINNKDLPQNVITICNPPYSKNISKYEAIEFLAKSSTHSLMCCYIFPKSQLYKQNNVIQAAKTTLLNNHYVIKILNIGEIFKNVKTGDITIIITVSKRLYRNIPKCLYYDLTSLPSCKYYKKTLRQNVYTITEDGWELIRNTKPTEITIDYNDYVILSDDRQKQLTEQDVRELLINIQLKKIIKEIKTDIYDGLTDLSIYTERLQQINNDVNNIKFKQVKLSELFVEVKCKKFTISKTTEGNIPLYGSSQVDKPVKFINDYSYSCQDDEQLVRINKNGSVGYCFRCVNTFALTSDVMLTRLLTPITDSDLYMISLQLNKLYDWKNKLNKDKFVNAYVYIINK